MIHPSTMHIQITNQTRKKPNATPKLPQEATQSPYAAAAACLLPPLPPRRCDAAPAPPAAPGLASVYLANALASAFLQLTFWLPTKLSTVTAMARSMSCAEQYSERRMRQNASLMRMMASRWRT